MSESDTPQAECCREERRESDLNLPRDLADYFKRYAHEKPEVLALCCLGVGFVLGWKLKPW